MRKSFFTITLDNILMTKLTDPSPPAITPSFSNVTGTADDYSLKIKTNIRLLLQGIEDGYPTKASINTDEAEAGIKKKFEEFLIGCEFHMAQKDFEATLAESKNRNDGSIGWYHQLSHIRQFLHLVKNGDISLEQLEEYGGLETAIRTALRHDSIEDFGISFIQFEQKKQQEIKATAQELEKQYPNFKKGDWIQKEQKNLQILISNLKLMTKKMATFDETGKPKSHDDGRMDKISLFKNTRAYTHNMIESENASPIVWVLKIFDGSHNLSSMIGAPKFTAPRRLKYANEREDMYGPRLGFTKQAMDKWPTFKNAIQKADHYMGAVLYTNIGYLEYVDQDKAYPNDDIKHNDGEHVYPLGIGRYLKRATSIDKPCGLSPLHNLLDIIKDQALNHEDKTTRMRANLFWQASLKPVLEKFSSAFPQINESKPTGVAPNPKP